MLWLQRALDNGHKPLRRFAASRLARFHCFHRPPMFYVCAIVTNVALFAKINLVLMERKFQRLGLFKPGNCDKLRLFKLQLEHCILFVDE